MIGRAFGCAAGRLSSSSDRTVSRSPPADKLVAAIAYDKCTRAAMAGSSLAALVAAGRCGR